MLSRAHDPQVLADVGDLISFSIRLSFAEHRQQAIRELACEAGTRARLEELQDVFLDRLYQRSYDFDASRALAMTIAALRYLDDRWVSDRRDQTTRGTGGAQ